MTEPQQTADDVLATAAQVAGLDVRNAVVIRDGSNVMYRLPRGIVARIGRQGTSDVAARQVEIARWLDDSGMSVVKALADTPQPTTVGNRPVTWWEELPEHRLATPGELGGVLRSLHAVRPPESWTLPHFDPFVGLHERLSAVRNVPGDDCDWLAQRIEELRGKLNDARLEGSDSVVHGDAWQGNVVVPETGAPILLDFERVSCGHPDWDLIPIAVDHVDFGRLSSADYRDFIAAYGGHDVTTTSAFRVLADIQELRWVIFVLGKAADSADAARETRHRVACLRGEVPRPWTWTAF